MGLSVASCTNLTVARLGACLDVTCGRFSSDTTIVSPGSQVEAVLAPMQKNDFSSCLHTIFSHQHILLFLQNINSWFMQFLPFLC